jgi:hypothetical protein
VPFISLLQYYLEHMGSITARPPKLQLDRSTLNGLLPLIQRLDARLKQVMITHQRDSQSISENPDNLGKTDEVEFEHPFLEVSQDSKPFTGAKLTATSELPDDSPLTWLQQFFGLSLIDLEVLTIALAPELERRYEKLYAYLQGDTRCQRPSVDLALTLLCSDAVNKLEQRRQFGADAPLRHHQLLHLVPNGDLGKPTFLAYELHLDEQVIQLLLAQSGLDQQLIPYCSWDLPSSLETFPLTSNWKTLGERVVADWQDGCPLRLYLQGADRQQQRQLVAFLAALVQSPVIRTDLGRLVQEKVPLEPLLKRMVRGAWFQNALLLIENLDSLQEPEHRHLYSQVWEAIATFPNITVLSGTQPYGVAPLNQVGVVTVPMPMLDVDQRRSHWQQHLVMRGISLEASEIERLSDRFQLTINQIANGVETACKTAQWQGAQPTMKDFFAAARSQSGHDLATHAMKIAPHYSWDDIVLPPDTKAHLREICNQAKYRHLVQETWGFNRKLALGQGLTVLFAGLPGTGKTMAAEVIAHELDLDLYKIDLSQE